MSSDVTFYRQLAASLAQGPVVVATVIQTTGSVPREVGAKLLMDATYHSFGTIGGGAGEAKVLQQAKEVLRSGEKRLVKIDLSGAPHREIQGICGGQMEVWLEQWSEAAGGALVCQVLESLENGQMVHLVTPLHQDQSAYLELGESSSPLIGLSTNKGFECFCMSLQPAPTLLIVGGGHCGIQLAKVADLAGFQVMVQDDRKDWANAQNFPQALRLFNQPIPTVLATLAHYSELYVALVTRGFDYDLAALEPLLNRQTPCRYIGMIGSRKRVRKVLNVLQDNDVPRHQLKNLYAPIGLNIGALTPEEIAVSITAELIMVRRGGTGRSLAMIGQATKPNAEYSK
jgi:xanthine dehydrogenase accessory factor